MTDPDVKATLFKRLYDGEPLDLEDRAMLLREIEAMKPKPERKPSPGGGPKPKPRVHNPSGPGWNGPKTQGELAALRRKPLLDARPLRVVRLTRPDGITSVIGPMCVRPTPDPLYAILTAVVDHTRTHPTHGASCICMDDYAREIRAHIDRAREARRPVGIVGDNTMQLEFMARTRIGYVLRMAIREV